MVLFTAFSGLLSRISKSSYQDMRMYGWMFTLPEYGYIVRSKVPLL